MSSGSPWSWPPKQEALKLAENVGELKSQNIKQCFDLKAVPKIAKPCKGEPPKCPVAAHCCLFARVDDSEDLIECLGNVDRRAAIMMQMRFDGALGFPGGVIDDTDNSVVEGLNRELSEEMDLDLKKFSFTDDDFVCCLYVPHDTAEDRAEVLRYFYAKEVSLEDFQMIEADSLKAKEYGIENFGNIRVPLHVFKETGGLPKFLKNQFPGSAVIIQLFWAIYMNQILTLKELEFSYTQVRSSSLTNTVI